MLSRHLALPLVKHLRHKQALALSNGCVEQGERKRAMSRVVIPSAWLQVPADVLHASGPHEVAQAEATAQAISQAACHACSDLLLHVGGWQECLQAHAVPAVGTASTAEAGAPEPATSGEQGAPADQVPAPDWPAQRLFDFWGRVYGDLALWAPQAALAPHLASPAPGAQPASAAAPPCQDAHSVRRSCCAVASVVACRLQEERVCFACMCISVCCTRAHCSSKLSVCMQCHCFLCCAWGSAACHGKMT